MYAPSPTGLVPELALLNDRVSRSGARLRLEELRAAEGIDNPEWFAEGDERYRRPRDPRGRRGGWFGRFRRSAPSQGTSYLPSPVGRAVDRSI